MIRDTLDNKTFRIIFALFAGIPLTLLFLVALPSGLIMGIVGLRDFETATLSMGIAAILGALGMIGAWMRIAKRIDNCSPGQMIFTRILLACGITASAILLLLTIWADTFLAFGLPMMVLLIGGILFYAGT